jgi:hypothetical protein
MIGGLLKSTSRFAIIAAAGMFVGGLALTSAKAADLGGDCCADLEERVADLEATTVRKGNKKVSLTISGQVARAIGYLQDDRGDGELYSAGNGPSESRIQFDGSAKLTSTWTAGYQIRMRMLGDRTTSLAYAGDANDSSSASAGAGTVNPEVDHNYVYLNNATFGTFLIGQADAPTAGVARINLTGRDVTGDSRGNNWNGIAQGFNLENDLRYQAIAYVSPTLAGFTLAVAWADVDGAALAGAANRDTDVLDGALRYAGEFGPIRVAAGVGYKIYDNNVDGSAVMGSAAVAHTPTGLNVAVAAGKNNDGGVGAGYNSQALAAGVANNEATFWHVQGGINQNFTGFGNTAIYGEYGSYDRDDASDAMAMWGVGVVQNFDSAATELFLAYRNWSDDDTACTGATIANTRCDADGDTNVSQVLAGMRIKF